MFDFLLTPAQKELREEVRRFVKEDVPRQLILDMDAEKVQYPREYVQAAAARNLLGLRFAREYGGRGLDWVAEVAALEEAGVLGTSLACLYSLPSIVGEAIHVFGTEEQKQKFLKPTLAGKLFCAEGLTEPRGGSDFFGATTVARREGDHYVLKGQKRFVVGAEGADYFLIYARTDENAPPHKGISAFLVERGPGVKVEYLYGLMGTRGGGAGRVVFDGCRVPADGLLGEENGAAAIFYRMMIPERLTSAAGALGMARAALEVAARYSGRRKAFGRVIKDFQAVGFKVADSITLLDAARGLVYATARAVDGGVPAAQARRLVSEAKKFATEAAWQIVNHAMQVMGGIGYTNVYPVERLLRDTRLIMIWTGTSEVMNLIIQHEYYRELAGRTGGRDVEYDAGEAMREEEKVFE
ncbi:acyl-CoA dehydrogenase family protein [Desulfotomaculum copahuensis]|uniref:Acyl-CoA dehydrogenase n=1 Tax=Desulfotomaculum copahuensis TaxID=1838280 RepID=A0A1B7LGQ2_9FIRM|nr:acyl-CoA dehydrogenase family protein [Desulfotomaculum copahuensis]OAT85228.1 acyl-CoA dehydrogenase [Desulfotomaculum copahuensis]